MFIRTYAHIEKRVKKPCPEILSVTSALSGRVAACYKFGIDKTTGAIYYKNEEGEWEQVPSSGSGGGGIESIQAGEGINVDNTDPSNPIISATSAGGSSIETINTYADISASTDKRFIYVEEDETNNGDHSLYLYTGTELKFLQTVA